MHTRYRKPGNTVKANGIYILYMWIYVDKGGYMWLYVDMCRYNYAHLSTYIPIYPMYPHVVPAFDARNDGFLRNDGCLRMRCSPLLQT